MTFLERKGEQLMELERDLPEEQGCRREVTAKIGQLQSNLSL